MCAPIYLRNLSSSCAVNFQKWAFITRHNFLTLSNAFHFNLRPNPSSAIDLHMFDLQVSICFLLFLVSAICPINVKFSKCLHQIYISFVNFFINLNINIFSDFIVLKISSLPTLSVNDMPTILLQNLISLTSIFLFSCNEIVSHSYQKNSITYQLRTFLFGFKQDVPVS